MAITRATKAYKREMRIILADLSRRFGTVPDDRSSQTAAARSTRPNGSGRSTKKTNRVIRAAYAAVFLIIVLITLLEQLAE